MRVWTNSKFKGHWPVGAAAVVVADTREQASELLSEELKQIGLGPALPEQFEPVDTERPGVLVLNSGDY